MVPERDLWWRGEKDLGAMGEVTRPTRGAGGCEVRLSLEEGGWGRGRLKMSYRVQEYINLFMYFISYSTVHSEKEPRRPTEKRLFGIM